MTATRLLVLGLVRRLGEAHGYRVSQELMAWQADKWANTKTGSIYHALRQLSKEGSLTVISGAEDKDGARMDYAITPSGETEFFAMLEHALSDAQPRADMLCAGLVFMAALPRQRVLALMHQRLEALCVIRDNTDEVARGAVYEGPGAYPEHIAALLAFQSKASEAQIAWLEDEIAKIGDGAYAFAGEEPGAAGARVTPLPAAAFG